MEERRGVLSVRTCLLARYIYRGRSALPEHSLRREMNSATLNSGIHLEPRLEVEHGDNPCPAVDPKSTGTIYVGTEFPFVVSSCKR